MIFFIVLAVVLVMYFSIKKLVQFKGGTRKENLMRKYNDFELVTKILDHQYWQGMTREQAEDSLGSPEDVDQKVMKSQISEIWKYHRTGKNRFRKKMHFENGILVGWELN